MAKRVDANQGEIVKALRKCGCRVQSLAMVGKGCPDLLVAWVGKLFLLEVKSNTGKLTPDQEAWHDEWCGMVDVVCSVADALKAIGATSEGEGER